MWEGLHPASLELEARHPFGRPSFLSVENVTSGSKVQSEVQSMISMLALG